MTLQLLSPLMLMLALLGLARCGFAAHAKIDAAGGSGQEKLAALELQRYTILATTGRATAAMRTATGTAAAAVSHDEDEDEDELQLSLVNMGAAAADGQRASRSALVRACVGDQAFASLSLRLAPQEHVIWRCTTDRHNGGAQHVPHFVLSGGDEAGVLFAAYAFAEAVLGVSFSIGGDRLPAPRPLAGILGSNKGVAAAEKLQRVRSPLFQRRGLQPFHDFREGPDWCAAATSTAFSSSLVAR